MATAPVLQEWGGSRLTNAAFLNYATSALTIMAKTGFDTLSLQTTGPALQAAVNKFAPFINKSSAFDETAAIAKLDAKRDALFNALWYAWHYCAEIDEDDDFGKHAFALRNIMNSYKGTYAHEITRESMEIQGLQRDLETQTGVNALKELGLYKIAGHLFEANTAVDTAYDARSEERGKREMAKEGETTASLRKDVATLLVQCSRRVNGAADFTPSEAVTAAIASVIGLIKQYKLVAAQPAHQGGDTPDPSPAPDPDPDPAPDPSDDGSDPSQG